MKIRCQACHVDTIFPEKMTGTITAEMLTKMMPRNLTVLNASEIFPETLEDLSESKVLSSDERVVTDMKIDDESSTSDLAQD